MRTLRLDTKKTAILLGESKDIKLSTLIGIMKGIGKEIGFLPDKEDEKETFLLSMYDRLDKFLQEEKKAGFWWGGSNAEGLPRF